MEHVYRPMHAGEGNLAIPFIGWIKVKKGSILSRLLKKFASKAAADESTGGVASGLRRGCFRGENAAGGLFQQPIKS